MDCHRFSHYFEGKPKYVDFHLIILDYFISLNLIFKYLKHSEVGTCGHLTGEHNGI